RPPPQHPRADAGAPVHAPRPLRPLPPLGPRPTRVAPADATDRTAGRRVASGASGALTGRRPRPVPPTRGAPSASADRPGGSARGGDRAQAGDRLPVGRARDAEPRGSAPRPPVPPCCVFPPGRTGP